MFSCEFFKIFKSNFFNRTPAVAASENTSKVTVSDLHPQILLNRKINIILLAIFCWAFQRQSLLQTCDFIQLYQERVTFRNSHQRCSVRKCVIRNFAKFTGKHLYQRLFFNKVLGLSTATLLKKRLWHRSFPVNFVKFLRTSFLQDTLDDCFFIW